MGFHWRTPPRSPRGLRRPRRRPSAVDLVLPLPGPAPLWHPDRASSGASRSSTASCTPTARRATGCVRRSSPPARGDLRPQQDAAGDQRTDLRHLDHPRRRAPGSHAGDRHPRRQRASRACRTTCSASSTPARRSRTTTPTTRSRSPTNVDRDAVMRISEHSLDMPGRAGRRRVDTPLQRGHADRAHHRLHGRRFGRRGRQAPAAGLRPRRPHRRGGHRAGLRERPARSTRSSARTRSRSPARKSPSCGARTPSLATTWSCRSTWTSSAT